MFEKNLLLLFGLRESPTFSLLMIKVVNKGKLVVSLISRLVGLVLDKLYDELCLGILIISVLLIMLGFGVCHYYLYKLTNRSFSLQCPS